MLSKILCQKGQFESAKANELLDQLTINGKVSQLFNEALQFMTGFNYSANAAESDGQRSYSNCDESIIEKSMIENNLMTSEEQELELEDE